MNERTIKEEVKVNHELGRGEGINKRLKDGGMEVLRLGHSEGESLF